MVTDGQISFFGGLKTETQSVPAGNGAPAVNFTTTTSMDWNADKTTALVRATVLVRADGKGELFYDSFKGDFHLVGNQIVSSLQGSTVTVACTYDRKYFLGAT
jgi:hypothetical protein